ncbi:Putative NTF2-like domain superfamily protein [Septoria linicola]|uniref:NTF2-like domain superfamily protein n=1 Tax=Septoria linicola TaxID=215465 RepID=A0A9Q9AJ63_9PEZI|nr:Putative NTF2-like domain superfamily protein [Septoria linicola]
MESSRSSNSSTETSLEAVCFAFIEAINARDLEAESAVWRAMPPMFRIGIDHTSQNQLPAFKDPEQFLTLAQFLDSWKQLTSLMPTYHIRVLDMVTRIDALRGVVYLNQEIHSGPEGVVTQNFGIREFRYRVAGDRWQFTRYTAARGMGDPILGAEK